MSSESTFDTKEGTFYMERLLIMAKMNTNSLEVQKLLDSDPRFEDALISHCEKHGLPLEVRGYWKNIEMYYDLEKSRLRDGMTLEEFKRRYREEPRYVEYKPGEAFMEIGSMQGGYITFDR